MRQPFRLDSLQSGQSNCPAEAPRQPESTQLNSIFHANRKFAAGPHRQLLGICFVQSHSSTQPQRVAKSELPWTFKWFFRASLNDRWLLDPSVPAPRLASSTSTISLSTSTTEVKLMWIRTILLPFDNQIVSLEDSYRSAYFDFCRRRLSGPFCGRLRAAFCSG